MHTTSSVGDVLMTSNGAFFIFFWERARLPCQLDCRARIPQGAGAGAGAAFFAGVLEMENIKEKEKRRNPARSREQWRQTARHRKIGYTGSILLVLADLLA